MLSVRQVAAKLGVSESTVYALVSKGLLKAHRVGVGRGVIRISAEAIGNYLDSNVSEVPCPRPRLPRPTLKHLKL